MGLAPVQRDDRSGAFFDATAAGRLLVHRCATCGHHFAPDYRACTACASTDITWSEAGLDATVVSWVVVHSKAPDDGVPPRSLVAVVEVPEGPWFTLPCEGLEPGAMRVGLAVRIGFVRPDASEAIPVATPA